jgi:hypothetical protein
VGIVIAAVAVHAVTDLASDADITIHSVVGFDAIFVTLVHIACDDVNPVNSSSTAVLDITAAAVIVGITAPFAAASHNLNAAIFIAASATGIGPADAELMVGHR